MSAQVIENEKFKPRDVDRNPITEKWMDDWGVSYELEWISLGNIDFGKSSRYQNRAGGTILEYHKNQIAVHLADPTASVPPIVVTRKAEKFLILDGNHRARAALEAGRARILAYVVSHKDANIFDQMAVTANARNAEALTPLQRERLVVDTARQVGQAAAAQQWGLSPHLVSDLVRAEIGREKLHRVGFNAETASRKQAAAAARLSDEVLRSIGAKSLKEITAVSLNALATDVLAQEPSTQAEYAKNRVQEIIGESKKPAAKRRDTSMTPARAANSLEKVRLAMLSDPSVKSDAKVLQKIQEILDVANAK